MSTSFSARATAALPCRLLQELLGSVEILLSFHRGLHLNEGCSHQRLSLCTARTRQRSRVSARAVPKVGDHLLAPERDAAEGVRLGEPRPLDPPDDVVEPQLALVPLDLANDRLRVPHDEAPGRKPVPRLIELLAGSPSRRL